jgi:hypothetical protein
MRSRGITAENMTWSDMGDVGDVGYSELEEFLFLFD